jgi:hypothetical protein
MSQPVQQELELSVATQKPFKGRTDDMDFVGFSSGARIVHGVCVCSVLIFNPQQCQQCLVHRKQTGLKAPYSAPNTHFIIFARSSIVFASRWGLRR